jgi:hypothetical protein
MVCLRNISVDTLQKGDSENDDDNNDDDDSNNNNNNSVKVAQFAIVRNQLSREHCSYIETFVSIHGPLQVRRLEM